MRCWFYFCSIKGFFYRQEWQPGVLLQVTGSSLHRGNLISYQGPRPFLFLNCKAFLLSTTDPFVALMTILFFSVLFCRDSETSFSTRMKLLQHWNQFFSNSVLCMDCLPWRHISPLFTKVKLSLGKTLVRFWKERSLYRSSRSQLANRIINQSKHTVKLVARDKSGKTAITEAPDWPRWENNWCSLSLLMRDVSMEIELVLFCISFSVS